MADITATTTAGLVGGGGEMRDKIIPHLSVRGLKKETANLSRVKPITHTHTHTHYRGYIMQDFVTPALCKRIDFLFACNRSSCKAHQVFPPTLVSPPTPLGTKAQGQQRHVLWKHNYCLRSYCRAPSPGGPHTSQPHAHACSSEHLSPPL